MKLFLPTFFFACVVITMRTRHLTLYALPNHILYVLSIPTGAFWVTLWSGIEQPKQDQPQFHQRRVRAGQYFPPQFVDCFSFPPWPAKLKWFKTVAKARGNMQRVVKL